MENKIPPKLRWACRRGMLELDVLLSSFLEEAYLKLDQNEQALFVELLENSDQDLFMWLTGRVVPGQDSVKYIVDKIRQHAKNRH